MMFGLAVKQLRRPVIQQCTSKVTKRFVVSARLELPKDVAGTRTKVVSTNEDSFKLLAGIILKHSCCLMIYTCCSHRPNFLWLHLLSLF